MNSPGESSSGVAPTVNAPTPTPHGRARPAVATSSTSPKKNGTASEEGKKTSLDAEPQPEKQDTPSRTKGAMQVTYWASHEPLENPQGNMKGCKWYEYGNRSSQIGTLKFFWHVGTDFIFTVIDNTWCCIPTTQLKCWDAKVV